MACHARLAVVGLSFVALVVTTAAAASASFHQMQIEQAVGGVCGDPSLQAIQLRLRFLGQNLVSGHEVAVYDANGENRLLLLSVPANVVTDAAGARILLATAGFAAATGITPDFVLTERLPDLLLRAGRLTFESSPGSILWALAWGGPRYLGTNTGLVTNDPDGDFGPAVPLALPSSSTRSMRFSGAASAGSTTNAADYVLSSGPATLTNNSGASVTLPACLFGDGFIQGDVFDWSDFLGVELCNGLDDDGDLQIDEDFPLGQFCALPAGGTGVFVCAPDGRGVLCT